MIRFYAPDILETHTLPEVESGHCCRVLRLKEGDVVECVDGKGAAYSCKICKASPKATELDIIESRKEAKHWKPSITLAVAPTKNIDRIEWMLEKATEIGVDKIVLLKCARSERKDVRTDRLEKILISAMKQSMKAIIPEFEGVVDFKKFMETEISGEKFMGYCSDSFPRKSLVAEYQSGSDVTILIGPEGDFSQQEVELAIEKGFVPVTFGDTRLRTETAALYALTAVQVINSCNENI